MSNPFNDFYDMVFGEDALDPRTFATLQGEGKQITLTVIAHKEAIKINLVETQNFIDGMSVMEQAGLILKYKGRLSACNATYISLWNSFAKEHNHPSGVIDISIIKQMLIKFQDLDIEVQDFHDKVKNVEVPESSDGGSILPWFGGALVAILGFGLIYKMMKK